MTPKVRIFLSYAREDRDRVKAIYRHLQSAGFEPWMDAEDILPGENWALCIQKAIRDSDFFLACLSANSVSKRGFLQRENKEALDIWSEKLDDDIYLIPVRLEACALPDRLGKFQWVDWFEETGPASLVKAIREGMKRRGVITGPAARPKSGGPPEDSAGRVPKPGEKPGPEPALEGEGGGRIGTKMAGAQAWYRALPSEAKAAVITGVVALLVAMCGLGGTLGAPLVQSAAARLFFQPTATPGVQAGNEFTYQVVVQARDAGRAISNAKVIVQVTGRAPVDDITDVNGLARVFVSPSLAGQPGVIVVEATGYAPYRQNIDLTQGALPDTVLLEPLPAPSAPPPPGAATPAPTGTPAGPPTPTHTPSPAPSVPPATPALAPAVTPTPAPDCRDVQVSLCLELLVGPNRGLQEICTQNTTLDLQRSQIEGLTNLQAQAVLTGTNAERCDCSWRGRADGSDWRTKTGSAGDRNFSLDLPPQVRVVDLQLTLGDRQKTTLFTVKIDDR